MGLRAIFPKLLILFIFLGYIPMIFLLLQDQKQKDSTRQIQYETFPHDDQEDRDALHKILAILNTTTIGNDPNRNVALEHNIDNKHRQHLVLSNNEFQNLQSKFDAQENSKRDQRYDHEQFERDAIDKSEAIKQRPYKYNDFNINDGDSHANPEIHMQQKEYLEKRQKQREQLEKQKIKPTKAAPKPKDTTTVNFDKKFDNALRNYKANEKKPTSPRPVSQRMRRPKVARATPPDEEVTEAKVIKGVIGNYEVEEIARRGPGEGGRGIPSATTKGEEQMAMREYGFNMVVSDMIALNRTVKDTRHGECVYWHYPHQLPNASVVIVFHNEGWSTLLRTVHSVIRTSPERLLHEIVMVDDYSNKPHLKSKLDYYISGTRELAGKVKLFHSPQRLGLIRARMYGAERATGSVLVFLDAHCECNRNWLPPLLSRIHTDRTIMTVPIIDGIDARTFEYKAIYTQPYRGIWEWGFFYKEYKVTRAEIATWPYQTSPYQSPTNAGGLFAIDRQYFQELGGYDPGLEIWGGENFELAFKVWMCGGSVEWVPCSRIGHVYRSFMPYGMGEKTGPVAQINYLRVVETWMDDKHKEYFYTREPTFRGVQYGDISEQLAFKEKHHCKSSQWFMDNVAKDVLLFYPPPAPNLKWGEIKEAHGDLCWDTLDATTYLGHIKMHRCSHKGGTQLFRLNVEGQLGYGEYCISLREKHLSFNLCARGSTGGPWEYDQDTGQIKHSSDVCIGSDRRINDLTVGPCDPEDPLQQWTISPVYPFRNLMSPDYLKQIGA